MKRPPSQIDSTELSVVFRALGMEYSEAEVMDLLALKDTDGQGTLDFGEFLSLMASELRDSTAGDEVAAAFERACGGDGYMGSSELLDMVDAMGVQLTAAQAEVMVEEVVKDRGAAGPEDRLTQQDVVRLMEGQ